MTLPDILWWIRKIMGRKCILDDLKDNMVVNDGEKECGVVL